MSSINRHATRRASERVRLRRDLPLIIAAVAFLSSGLSAQKIEIDTSACAAAFRVLKAMNGGAPRETVSAMLDAVLDSRPYQVMFRHYNRFWRPNHLPRDVFKRMILSLRFEDAYARGENERADKMLATWRRFYEDLPLFERNLRQLEKANLPKLVRGAVRYAQSWLPPGWRIPDFYLCIHPDGGSPGFALPGEQGFDFFQVPRSAAGDMEWDKLLGTISHECHHLGMKLTSPSPLSPADKVAFQFLTYFVGEGTATKFISKAPGGSVPVVTSVKFPTAFTGDLLAAWKDQTSRERQIFERLVTTFDKACAGEMTATDLEKETGDWFGGLVGPAYFAGAELFGAIYFAFGKKGVFAAMEDPRRLFDLYDRAIDKKPRLLSGCPRIPTKTVEQALAIGRS